MPEAVAQPTPNHVPCKFCRVPCSWDGICWTHDDTGFADCGLTIEQIHMITFDPTITLDPDRPKTYAEPEGDWS